MEFGAKRIIDVVCSSLLLLLFSPVIIVLAILIRWVIGKPVIFKQARPGLHAKLFTMYKFRTMKDVYDGDGNLLPDGERLTKFGGTLRKYSLDELPQLFSVLKGDMSLVGPRPLLVEYLPLYSKEQARRHEVKPGITGWAQINGRNAISWEEKFKLDVWYVDHQSLQLDLKILYKTFKKVLYKEDINKSGHATMEKFSGNRK